MKHLLIIFFLACGMLIYAHVRIRKNAAKDNLENLVHSNYVTQVAHITTTGLPGSLHKEIKNPYYVSTITEREDAKGIDLNVSAYPNPTNCNLTVNIDNFKTNNLNVVLMDATGEEVLSKSLDLKLTELDLHAYPAGTYFAKIQNPSKAIKTFKIVKIKM